MCDNYPVIPQFGGTCWFNTIITACCYSENLKKLMIKKSKKWDKSNSFFKYLKTILKYSYSTDNKIKKMFIKEKPEYLLFKYLDYFDKPLKKILRLMIHYYYNHISLVAYYNINYIITFFRKIGVNCLDIIILDNNEYLVDFDKNIKLNLIIETLKQKNYSFPIDDIKYEFRSLKFEIKDKIKEPNLSKIPEVIVIQPSNIYNKNIPDSNLYKNIPDSNLYKYITKDFNIKFNSSDYIEYKGYKYKLDACILVNYNDKYMNHVILGFTCNNKRYIYNSLNSNKKLKKPCGFYKFNWDINVDTKFYFDYDKCKIRKVTEKNIRKIEEKHQVFSFYHKKIACIYVKSDDNDINNNNDINSDGYYSISKKREMKNSFYDIKNITLSNLKSIIRNLGYTNKFINKKSKELLMQLLQKKIDNY
jgi:hypothetical protein